MSKQAEQLWLQGETYFHLDDVFEPDGFILYHKPKDWHSHFLHLQITLPTEIQSEYFGLSKKTINE